MSGAAGPVGAGDHLRVCSRGHAGAVPSRPGCPVARCPSPPAALVPFSLVTGGGVILLPGGRGSVPTTPMPNPDRSAWHCLQAPGCINSGKRGYPALVTPGDRVDSPGRFHAGCSGRSLTVGTSLVVRWGPWKPQVAAGGTLSPPCCLLRVTE